MIPASSTAEPDRERGPRRLTEVHADGRDNPFFPSHSLNQEDNVDRSYLSEGLEYPEQSLHPTNTTGECLLETV